MPGLKNQPSSILPGRVTYVQDVSKGMRSIYEINMDLNHMSALIEKIEARVEKWFFNDLFQMMENIRGRTAAQRDGDRGAPRRKKTGAR